MTLIKYNPVSYSPASFRSFVDRFFNDDFHGGSSASRFSPNVDIAETEAAFEIDVVVPGIKKDEISVDVNNGILTVSGERKFKKENDDKNYRSVESYFGEFKRSFQLPDNVDQDKVAATYDEGILRINVPKDEKKIAKRTIAVK